MGWFLALLGLAIIVAVTIWLWRRASTAAAREGPQREAWQDPAGTTGARIVLDLDGADPDHPSVQRLVRGAAHSALTADPNLDHVEVVGRDGTVLGTHERPAPLGPDATLPEVLREPHASPRHAPSPVPHESSSFHLPGDDDASTPSAPLGDRLDLTPQIRARVTDPDDPANIVRAILEATGRPVTGSGDLIIFGDSAVAVADVRVDPATALTQAFLRIDATPAKRGIVLRNGFVAPDIVRRREAAARHVRHVGPDGLQRMADAVAAGADPIAFAAGPVTIG